MDLFDGTTAPKAKPLGWRPRRGRPRKQTAPMVMENSFAAVIRTFMTSTYWDSLKPATRDTWGRELRLIASSADGLGGVPVDEVRPKLVQAWLEGFATKPGKQHVCLHALRRLAKWAMVRELLPGGDITFGCTINRGKGGRKPWTDEQIATALAHAPRRFYRAIRLGAETGQRPSDLVRMKWADLETIDGRLGINLVTKKVGLTLWIPFTREFEREVMEWQREWRAQPAQTLTILTDPKGKPWHERNMGTDWSKQVRHRATPEMHGLLGCTLHGLRATACVRLMRAGATTRQISDMVGLSEPMVTRYCRFASRKKTASATIMLLDGARTNEGNFRRNTPINRP